VNKFARELRRESRARIERESGRALRNGASGREDSIESSAPHLFAHPRAEAFHVLVTRAPAVVAAFDEMQHATRVRTSRVVVHGPEISVVIERELLRIAQAGAEDFEVATIGFATQHAAGVRNI
jgi:hypothetical protein